MSVPLEDLIDSYLNESLSETEWAALNERLAQSGEARNEFRARVRVHSSLADHYSGADSVIEIPGAWKRSPGLGWTGVAAALLLGLFVVFAFWKMDAVSPARIISSDSLAPGPVSKGKFSIPQGFVEVEMAGGARFALEAGTEIEILGPDRVRLIRGSLGADVPECGRGFTVVTPGGEVVDLGTRFGVTVDSSGKTKAELFQGEIEVHSGKESENFQGQAVVAISENGNEIVRLSESIRPHDFPMPELVEVIPIAQGNFEPGETYEIGESTRDEVGVWGGNVARIVTETDGITPFEGKGMLQLVSSSQDPAASGLTFCDVLQWIDLSEYVFRSATISARMKVNRIPGDEKTDTRFQMIVTPRSVPPSSLSPEERQRSANLEWQVSREADGDASTWETLELTAPLTGETRFLQLHVGAAENRQNNSNPGEVEFDGHFIDQVELLLLIPARPAFRP